jgi:hypothetical protein
MKVLDANEAGLLPIPVAIGFPVLGHLIRIFAIAGTAS